MHLTTSAALSRGRIAAALAAGALLATTASCGSGSPAAAPHDAGQQDTAVAADRPVAATPAPAASSTPAPAESAAPVVAHRRHRTAPIKNAVAVTMPGMRYVVRGHLRPGVAAITLRNTDDEAHMMAVARLRPGVTRHQVVAAMKKGGEQAVAPLLADRDMRYGVPGPVGVGASTTVTAPRLRAGNYALICFFNGKDGMPHWAMGMIGMLRVKGPKQQLQPRSKGTITISDKGIRLPGTFDGHGTYAVKDVGTKPHNLSFAKLSKGTTLKAYAGYVGQRMQSGQPIDGGGGVLWGGVDGLNPGQRVWLTLDLPRGHYGYLSTEDITGPGVPGQHGEVDVH